MTATAKPYAPYDWPTRMEWNALSVSERRERAQALVDKAARQRAATARTGVPTDAQKQAAWWMGQIKNAMP